MMEKITLDMLTNDSVSLKKQQFTMIGGIEYPIGPPWRRAYVNSIEGRESVASEVAEPYKSVIMLMWGNAPTMIEATE